MLDLLSNVIESHSILNCSSWRGGWLKHFSNNIWSTLRCLATHLNFTSIWPKCRKKYWIGLERQKNTKFCKKILCTLWKILWFSNVCGNVWKYSYTCFLLQNQRGDARILLGCNLCKALHKNLPGPWWLVEGKCH